MSNSLALLLPEHQDEEEDDEEEDVERTYRLHLIPRSSPTPRKRSPVCDDPGDVPLGRKVKFADARGLELAQIHYFEQYPEPEEEEGARAGPAFRLCPAFSLVPAEQLLDLVRRRKVELESARCPPDDPLSVHCLARVLNLSYQKVVQARCTTDEWATHYDHPADYVPGSSDGTSDQFAFRLPFPGTCARDGARLHFVLRYETPGGVYWANNGGANFTVVCRAAEGTGREPPPQGIAICLRSCLKVMPRRFDDKGEDAEHSEWDTHSPRPPPSHTAGLPTAIETRPAPGAYPNVLILEPPVSSQRIAGNANPPPRTCDWKAQVPEVQVMDPESKGLSPPFSGLPGRVMDAGPDVLFVPIREGALQDDVAETGPEGRPASLEGVLRDDTAEAEPERGPPSLEGAPQCDWAEGGPLSLEGALQDETEETGPEGGGPLSPVGALQDAKMEAGPEGRPPSPEGLPHCVWTKGGPPSLEGALQDDTIETGPEGEPLSLKGAPQDDMTETRPEGESLSLEGAPQDDMTETRPEGGPLSLEGAPRDDATETRPEGGPLSLEGEDDWRGSQEARISLEGERGVERERRSARLYAVPGLHAVGACEEEEEDEDWPGGGEAIPQDPGSASAHGDPDVESMVSLLGTTLRVTEVLLLLVVALSEPGSVIWCTLYLFTLVFT